MLPIPLTAASLVVQSGTSLCSVTYQFFEKQADGSFTLTTDTTLIKILSGSVYALASVKNSVKTFKIVGALDLDT